MLEVESAPTVLLWGFASSIFLQVFKFGSILGKGP
jgi:hypothetical protein